MSNYRKIREVIRRMSGQDNVITVPKIYIEFTGDLTTAVLLNQLVFYSDKGKRADGFFYKTYKDWERETSLTERQVRYSVKKLRDLGLVETKLKKANGAPTLHYLLDYDKLLDSIMTKCQIGNSQNVSIDSDTLSESLTENTTENTTEQQRHVNEGLDNLPPKEKPVVVADQSFGDLIRFYEQNIGMITPMISDELGMMTDDLNAELALLALKESVIANAKNKMRYAQAILKSWKSQNFKTVTDVENAEKRRKPNKPNDAAPVTNHPKGIDW